MLASGGKTGCLRILFSIKSAAGKWPPCVYCGK